MTGSARVAHTAEIPAPAHQVYALIADYRRGHPRILPRRYFPGLEVDHGGRGAGTIIRFQVRVLGRTRQVRAEISEPVPGEELVETDLDTGARTSFLVRPTAGGKSCEVTIRTEWEPRGLQGWLERVLAPPVLRRIYREELAQLAAVAAGGPEPEATADGPAGDTA